MVKIILASFTSAGTPQTGLSPTIRIRDLSDNSLAITDAAMTEVGDGFYKYSFATYDEDKEYSIRADGTATLAAADRYQFAGNESYVDDLWDAQTTDHDVIGSLAVEMRTGSGGSMVEGEGRRLSLEEAQTLARMVWEVILKGEEKAKDVLLSRSDFDALKDKVLLKDKIKVTTEIVKVTTLPAPDLSPVTKAIGQLTAKVEKLPTKFPELETPTELAEIMATLTELKELAPAVEEIRQVVAEVAVKEIDLSTVENLVAELQALLTNREELTAKQVNSLLAGLGERQVEEMRALTRLVLLGIKNAKYDLIRSI